LQKLLQEDIDIMETEMQAMNQEEDQLRKKIQGIAAKIFPDAEQIAGVLKLDPEDYGHINRIVNVGTYPDKHAIGVVSRFKFSVKRAIDARDFESQKRLWQFRLRDSAVKSMSLASQFEKSALVNVSNRLEGSTRQFESGQVSKEIKAYGEVLDKVNKWSKSNSRGMMRASIGLALVSSVDR
jgi:hypothetical protein